MENRWLIEGFFGANPDSLQSIPLQHFPALIGRDPTLTLCINKSEVSRRHAELTLADGLLCLRDLGSTNGTFVNHRRIAGAVNINHGDVVHFGSVEVRLLNEMAMQGVEENDRTMFIELPLGTRLPTGLGRLQKLLDERAVTAEFQPIVTLDGDLYGYEVLGRGNLGDALDRPGELFHIAESAAGKAALLSELMRDCGVRLGAQQGAQTRLFVNTHPEELRQVPRLLDSLKQLRDNHAAAAIVLEIHEDAVTDVRQLIKLAEALRDIGVEVAYDDFGAGQSRLQELIDVPVSYVKFDVSLIRGIHKAPAAKQDMVAALVAMTRSLGITTLAEGVEQAEELALCRTLNFDLIQGFYFGRPAPLMAYSNPLR